MVLVFLRELHPEFSKARPDMIDSLLSSQLRISTTSYMKMFLRSHRIQPLWRPKIILLLRFKAKQQAIETVRVILDKEAGRSYGNYHSGWRAREVIHCYYCKKLGYTKYPLPQGKQQQQLFHFAHVAIAREE